NRSLAMTRRPPGRPLGEIGIRPDDTYVNKGLGRRLSTSRQATPHSARGAPHATTESTSRDAVERDRAADDRGVGAGLPPPRPLAQHGDLVAPLGVLPGREAAAEQRRVADEPVDIARD